MSVIKGADLHLFIGTKSIAYSTSHTLSISAETTEVSSKDNGGVWKDSDVNTLSWECSSENLMANSGEGVTFDELFTYMTSRQKLNAVFALEGNSTDSAKLGQVPSGGWTPKAGDGYTGKAVITSLSLNAPNSENASFSVTCTGAGPLAKVSLS